MKYRRRSGNDQNRQEESHERQVSDVKSDKKDEDRTLYGEAEHIARLRQYRGIAGDGSNDSCATNSFKLQKFGAPYMIHEAHAEFVYDCLDFGRCRDGDVFLRLHEQEERDQKE